MLDIVTDAMSWANALHSVRKLAVQTRLTGYDAAYLELAHRRGIPLATLDLDLDLLKAAQAIGVPVIQHQPSQ